MIYLTLPNLHFNFKINAFFSSFVKKNPNYFKAPIKIFAFSGTPSYCYWNGDLNSHFDKLLSRSEIQELSDHIYVNTRLNCSNVNLTETDFYDTKLAAILEIFENGANLVEISDFSLMNHIKEKFPNYYYIFSANAHLKNPFTAEILNVLTDQNIFSLIEIPNDLATLDFISTLKNRNMFEINLLKHNFCDSYKTCLITENTLQYGFSQNSCFGKCKKCVDYSSDFFLNFDEILAFNKLGIQHFKLPSNGYGTNERFNYVKYFIHTFIKPEYQQIALEEFVKEVLT